MPEFAFRIDEDAYSLDLSSLTMGEKWLLERDYGLKIGEDADSTGGIGISLGLMVVALMRAEPFLSEAKAKAHITALTEDRVVFEEAKPDPPPRAAKGGKRKSAIPAASGDPS